MLRGCCWSSHWSSCLEQWAKANLEGIPVSHDNYLLPPFPLHPSAITHLVATPACPDPTPAPARMHAGMHVTVRVRDASLHHLIPQHTVCFRCCNWCICPIKLAKKRFRHLQTHCLKSNKTFHRASTPSQKGPRYRRRSSCTGKVDLPRDCMAASPTPP